LQFFRRFKSFDMLEIWNWSLQRGQPFASHDTILSRGGSRRL
jgi:hypothetical protein